MSEQRSRGTAAGTDLLAIGAFARLAGLSIGALRHYAELDLLRPARVDPATGYRSYRRDQLERARLIGTLRSLEVPLEEVRPILDADDARERRRLVDAERSRAHAQATRLGQIAHALAHLATEQEVPSMSQPQRSPEIDQATRRALAGDLFNRCWRLMEIADRTPAQDDEMVHAAHASRHHWGEVGTTANLARGEWMCARVYSVLGRAEPALHHARRCLDLIETAGPDSGLEDWDMAAAYECLARASLVAGDTAAAAAWRSRALTALDAVADPEDRETIAQDVAALPPDGPPRPARFRPVAARGGQPPRPDLDPPLRDLHVWATIGVGQAPTRRRPSVRCTHRRRVGPAARRIGPSDALKTTSGPRVVAVVSMGRTKRNGSRGSGPTRRRRVHHVHGARRVPPRPAAAPPPSRRPIQRGRRSRPRACLAEPVPSSGILEAGAVRMTDLRLGINLWSQGATWPQLLDAARRVDRLGYDSLWTWDHLYAIVGDPHQPIFEGWGMLHAWAMATERVRLGLLVGANTFRNPGLVAKQATTLDHVSGGRAILGLGGAWMQLEHDAHGIDFGAGFGQRLDWLDESVAAIRSLLDGESVSSPDGGRYAFHDLRHAPRPVQPRLPIMIGGNGRTKTLRTIARYADQWNGFGPAAELAELDTVLRDHCAAVGRDEAQIARTANTWLAIRDTEAEARDAWLAWMRANRTGEDHRIGPWRPLLGPPALIAEKLGEYVAAGFSTMLVEVPAPYDVETLERLIGEVKPLVDAR